MTELYPDVEPYKTEFLKVSDLHTLYLEQSGNPDGIPVTFLHGGPGARSKPKHRKFFDPEKYRIILFDQRGCGHSTPSGELKENTTQDLVEDMEKIRQHLGIEKWSIVGSSWGTTVALTYAETYPQHVKNIILRGVFLFRKFEIEWLFGGGAKYLFPDVWEKYTSILSNSEKGNMVESYTKRVLSDDESVYLPAIKAAAEWDEGTSSLFPLEPSFIDPTAVDEKQQQKELVDSYKILFHYIQNNGFLKDGQLLDEVGKIRNIPAVIIHGRYDLICPLVSAWELHRRWPEASFELVNLAGHRSEKTEMIDKIVEYADKFAKND
jgi:proline iminopeptidase